MPLFDDTRADWAATAPTKTLTRVAPTTRVGVSWHWIGTGKGPSATGPHTACLRRVKDWQAYHRTGPMKAKDLGYNGLICQHGRAIEGRGVAYSGSHSPGVNVAHIGIQFMCGEGDPPPNAAMIARAVKLRADLDREFPNLRRDWGHRDDPDASTECPGNDIAAWVKAGGPNQNTTPTPPQEEDDMFTDADRKLLTYVSAQVKATAQLVVDRDLDNLTAEDLDALGQKVADNVVARVGGGGAEGVTPDALKQAVKDALKEGIA